MPERFYNPVYTLLPGMANAFTPRYQRFYPRLRSSYLPVAAGFTSPFIVIHRCAPPIRNYSNPSLFSLALLFQSPIAASHPIIRHHNNFT
jgi:hypothetical protein